jgi:hypothetical protein
MRPDTFSEVVTCSSDGKKYLVAFSSQNEFELVKAILMGNVAVVNEYKDKVNFNAGINNTQGPDLTFREYLYQHFFSKFRSVKTAQNDSLNKVKDFIILQTNPEIVDKLKNSINIIFPADTLKSALEHNNAEVALLVLAQNLNNRSCINDLPFKRNFEQLRSGYNYRGHCAMLEMLNTINARYPAEYKSSDDKILTAITLEKSTLEQTLQSRENRAYLRAILYTSSILFAYSNPLLLSTALVIASGAFIHFYRHNLNETLQNLVLPFILDTIQNAVIDTSIITNKGKEIFETTLSYVQNARANQEEARAVT